MVKTKVKDAVEYTLKYYWKLQGGMINYNYFLMHLCTTRYVTMNMWC